MIYVVRQLIIKVNQNFFNSKTHKYKEQYGIVVKEYEIIKPEIDEVDHTLDKVIETVEIKFFHTIEFICVYDIEIIGNTNNEEVNLAITPGYMNFKTEIFGLNEKNQKCSE